MKEKIKISFLSSIKDRELLYTLRSELSTKGFFVAVEEWNEEKYMAPGMGAAGPDFIIKEVFLPLIKVSLTIPLILILKGFFNEIGSDAYKKIKEILVRVFKKNKEKGLKSRGVVIEIIKQEPKLLNNQLWFFFLDSIENDKIVEALKKIKEAITNNSNILGRDYLKKIWKIGFNFNNKEGRWEILDIQELPPWMLKEKNNNQAKKLKSIITTVNGTKKTEDRAFTFAELEAQIITLMKQLGELHVQLPENEIKKNIKNEIKKIYNL